MHSRLRGGCQESTQQESHEVYLRQLYGIKRESNDVIHIATKSVNTEDFIFSVKEIAPDLTSPNTLKASLRGASSGELAGKMTSTLRQYGQERNGELKGPRKPSTFSYVVVCAEGQAIIVIGTPKFRQLKSNVKTLSDNSDQNGRQQIEMTITSGKKENLKVADRNFNKSRIANVEDTSKRL